MSDTKRQCRFCGGPLYKLGKMGNLMHLRCRNCGMDCNREERPRRRQRDTEDRRELTGFQAAVVAEQGDW
jgi:uncharacterized Zn finger protein (UPF0148 family)